MVSVQNLFTVDPWDENTETYERRAVCGFALFVFYWLITNVNDAPFSYMDTGLDNLQYPPQAPCFGVCKSDTHLMLSNCF